MHHRASTALFLLLLLPRIGEAQHRAVTLGDRITLMAASEPARASGVIVGLSAGHLALQTAAHAPPLLVPWSDVTRLEVHEARTARSGAWRGTKWGVAIGGAVGALLLVTATAEEKDSVGGRIVIDGIIAGAGIGALAGAIRPGRRWRAVDVAAAQVAAARYESTTVAESAVRSRPAPALPRQGRAPALEFTVGLTAPMSRYAQFPGLALATAINAPGGSTRGAALVADVDFSAYRSAFLAGPRLYARTAPVSSARRSLTVFGQLVAGTVRGSQSGVVRSQGGFAYQPGVGADYGRGAVAGRLQLDYSVVPDGYVDDERIPGRHVERLTAVRVVAGITLRWPSW